MVMQTSPASQRHGTSEVPRQEASPTAPEASTAVEQAEEEEEAVDGADDALDSGLEVDDDVDLAYDEEVGITVVALSPSWEDLLRDAYTSCEFISRHAVTPVCVVHVWCTCYFTTWYRSLSKQVLYVCIRETRMKMCFMKTLMMKRPCGSLRR